jgi:hypothetical protein
MLPCSVSLMQAAGSGIAMNLKKKDEGGDKEVG